MVILINSYKKIEQLNFQLFPIIFIAVVAYKIEWHCNLRVIQQKFRDEDIPMEWNKDNAMATLDVATRVTWKKHPRLFSTEDLSFFKRIRNYSK